MAKYNEDAWRMVGEKVTADIAAAITAGLANGGAIATAIAGAITAGLGTSGAITTAIGTAISTGLAAEGDRHGVSRGASSIAYARITKPMRPGGLGGISHRPPRRMARTCRRHLIRACAFSQDAA